MPYRYPEYRVFKDGSLRIVPKGANNKFEKKNSNITDKNSQTTNANGTDEIKIVCEKLEFLIDNVEQMQKQINELEMENSTQKKSNLDDEKSEDIRSEDNIIKYTNIAKVIANLIEKLADGIIVIIDNINDPSNKKSTLIDEHKNSEQSSKKLDISGILKSAEDIISSLVTSTEK